MKNLSTFPAWHETPRTNALVQEIQSTPIPFDISFWRLLELTRIFEVEINKLKNQLKKSKKSKLAPSGLAKKKVAAGKTKGRPKAKLARKS